MRAALRRYAGPGVVGLFGIGQSVSGFQSPLIGVVLMVLAVLWAAWYLLEGRKQQAASASPRGRLEAHAGHGKVILARIDKASEDYPAPFWGRGLIAQAEAMESAQPQATVLRGDRDGWIATATGLVERLASNLLDEYKTDYVVRTSRVTAGVFHDLREPLRQRLDGLQRVIDAMEDQ
jgi:hypothetical protein